MRTIILDRLFGVDLARNVREASRPTAGELSGEVAVTIVRRPVPPLCAILLSFGFVLPLTAPAAQAQSHVIASWGFASFGGQATSSGPAALVTGGQSVMGTTGSSGHTLSAGFPSLQGGLGPRGSILTPAAMSAGSDAVIVASLYDDQAVIAAELHYRMGGEATFAEVDMAESPLGSGLWRATIPALHVTPRGIQYFVEARDASVTARFPAAGVASLPIRLTGLSIVSLPAAGYRLGGVSMAADGGGSPLSVFDELGPFDATEWRYGTWNGSRYDEGAAAANAVPGQGFWIISRNAIGITASGLATDVSGSFGITLHPGFNQIANPFSFPVPFADLDRPAVVSANLIEYDGAGYLQFRDALESGKGYWIFNSSGVDQILGIPAAPTPPPAPAAPPVPANRPWMLRADEAGWTIEAAAVAGDRHDAGNHFGMRETATDGLDGLDFVDAPAPPRDWVSLSFLAGGAGEGEGGLPLSVDYRALAPDGATWLMQLTSDLVDKSYRVDFSGVDDIPADWRLVALDAAGSIVADLREQPVLEGTLGAAGFSKTWHVVAGSPGFIEQVSDDLVRSITAFRLSVGPNPFRSHTGTVFALAVPQPTQASLRIYDVEGRLVRTLIQGPVERGVHRVTWRGTNDSNRGVASGVYFARVRTDTFETVRKVLLLR